MPTARAKGRGNAPRIFMNGQAAAYSSRCRIREAERYHPQKLVSNRERSLLFFLVNLRVLRGKDFLLHHPGTSLLRRFLRPLGQ